jgi:hypothetical protein
MSDEERSWADDAERVEWRILCREANDRLDELVNSPYEQALRRAESAEYQGAIQEWQGHAAEENPDLSFNEWYDRTSPDMDIGL